MRWLMSANYQCVIPNSNQFFSWEADLIAINRSWLISEFEIKLNMADYKRDATKHKHHFIGNQDRAPAYFWYVTYDFDIEPPIHAGWIKIKKVSYPELREQWHWNIEIKKRPKRLNRWYLTESHLKQALRLASWQLSNSFYKQYSMIPDGKDAMEIEANHEG